MWAQFLSWEDLLEEETAIHSSILAWKIRWTEEPGGLQSTVLRRVRHDCSHQHARLVDIKIHWIYCIIECHFKFSWSAAISFEFDETIDVYIQIV